jgi:potassium-transporting ATPase potassium-binding subunit
MPRNDILTIIVYFLALLLLAYPLGKIISDVLQGVIPVYLKWLTPIEKLIYKISGLNPQTEQKAKKYLKDLLLFNAFGFALLFLILLTQGYLPLNPQNYTGLSWHLAFNTAASFMTNTNWQAYSGEGALSNFSQMVGLTTQNFVSAATGLGIVAVLARGLFRKVEGSVGNFGADLVRGTLYILLPLSFIFAILLVSQGVVQNFSAFVQGTTLEGATQLIPMGPAASQIAIKQLGTNGGGFFGVNSAHPFENPTPFSNFLQVLAILLIPVAQVFAFGRMMKKPKEGFAILCAMFLIFIPLLTFSLWSEHQGIPGLGATLEGKEVRFGVTESVLWGASTTAASNGSVNAMHSSFTPLTGMIFIFQILTGEVILGGAGAGLYGIALYAIITLFLAGLMVGRSPEWFGKKIEAYEVKLALMALLVPCALILIGVSLGIVMPWGLSALSHQGPHGLSELLYGFASTVGNNGSAFGGLGAGSAALNTIFGCCMLIGRFVVIIPIVLIAGSLGMKKSTPASSGTFPTDGPLFVVLLAGIILIFGALTFFPVLALGPIAEHFLMLAGQTF